MAGKQNLTIEKNATFRKRIRYTGKNKRPVDLTGYTAKLQARTAPGNATVLLELTTENGGIVIAPGGVITLVVPLVQARLLTFQTAVYDLILIAPGGDRVRLLEGRILVSPGVTE